MFFIIIILKKKTHQYIAITEPKIDCAGDDKAPGRAVRIGSAKKQKARNSERSAPYYIYYAKLTI